MVYMRGGIDIKAIITGDADFGTGSTTAVTAFVAGAPLRVVMSMNAFVDQALYAQPKYRNLAQLKGQSIGSLNPGGLVDTLLRRIIVKEGFSPERDFILLNMGGTPERYAALKSGTLAASMLSAPHSLRAEKDGFIKIAATRDYVDVPGTAFVTHADKIKKQPNMIKRFMRAGLRAMNYIRDNRADTTQMIMREFGMDQEIAGWRTKCCSNSLAPMAEIASKAINCSSTSPAPGKRSTARSMLRSLSTNRYWTRSSEKVRSDGSRTLNCAIES